MVYKYTIDNIISLLQTVGTLTKEQIMRFFSGELADYRVEYLLNQLAIKHILIYDEEADTFSFVGAAHYRKESQEKLIKSFWILVAAGSSNAAFRSWTSDSMIQSSVLRPRAECMKYCVIKNLST